jgi:hypothetical protein
MSKEALLDEYRRLLDLATHAAVKTSLAGLIAQLEAAPNAIAAAPAALPAPAAAPPLDEDETEDERVYEEFASKPLLILQLHQEIIVKSISNKILPVVEVPVAAAAAAEDLVKNRYLIGVLPRGGKTYIAGGIIAEFCRQKRILNKSNTEAPVNIVWFTATPNETKSQVGEDLIKKFIDFGDFVFISYPFVAGEFENEEISRR